MTTDTRRIYVACLAAYNNGVLHGEWIDCEGKDADDLQEEVNAILRSSPYPNVQVEFEGKMVPSSEEFAIHDHEGFGDLVEEYTSLKDVAELARLLDEHGDAYLAYVSNVGLQYATEEGFTDSYQGEYKSATDWAEQFADDTGMLESVPENLRYYFDFEAYARDARLNGDLSFVEYEGSTYVFDNH